MVVVEEVEPKTPRRTGRIVADPELLAMSDVAEVMDLLPIVTRGRVLRWVNERYQMIDDRTLYGDDVAGVVY